MTGADVTAAAFRLRPYRPDDDLQVELIAHGAVQIEMYTRCVHKTRSYVHNLAITFPRKRESCRQP